jgi:hypothetical protein
MRASGRPIAGIDALPKQRTWLQLLLLLLLLLLLTAIGLSPGGNGSVLGFKPRPSNRYKMHCTE